MEVVGEQPAPEEVLFADKTLGGYIVVRENATGEEARLDLETLFNTVIANRDRIRELFVSPDMEGREEEKAREDSKAYDGATDES